MKQQQLLEAVCQNVVFDNDLQAALLSYETNGYRFIFRRREKNATTTYVWLGGDILTPNGHHDPIDWIKRVKEHLNRSVTSDSNQIRFVGGAFAFFSYETLAAIQGAPPELSGRGPKACVVITKSFAVIDEATKTITFVTLRDQSIDEGNARLFLQSLIQNVAKQQGHRIRDTSLEVGEWKIDMDAATYTDRVNRIKALINESALDQMILSVGLSADGSPDPVEAFNALCRLNPSPHMYLMTMPEYALVGSSPLMHMVVINNKLLVETDAGTRPVGASPLETEMYERELRESSKDRAEQEMVVESTLLDLYSISVPETVHVGDVHIRKFSHTMHLYTSMEAQLRPGLHPLDAMLHAAPVAAVVGHPKAAVYPAISTIEGAYRGAYGGLVAMLGFDGYVDSAVILRSFWIDDEGVHLRSGGGITIASDAMAERDEALQKAKTIQQLFQSLPSVSASNNIRTRE